MSNIKGQGPAMLEAGHSRRAIGRQLHTTHRTVKSLADAARPEDLFRGQWQYNQTPAIDEYKPYLDERGTKTAPTPGSSGRR
ncbi:hypothetical protein [Streptomyces rochei]|uniref:hypothetical protein n=1 Tax=Streptomyces rochei TaxID=1928 RepID=UPI0036A23C6D